MDFIAILSGFGVGAIVGMTGVGGGSLMTPLLLTFAIMGRSINGFELRDADVVLRPKLPGVSGADFTSRKKSILAGREATLAQLAALREKIAQKML